MKAMVLATAAASSSRTPPTAARYRRESRGDSSYFPGCRRDANCHCEICLASINATLDLIPSGSAITKLSCSRPNNRKALRTLRLTDDSETSSRTPETGSSSGGIIPRSPVTKSTAKSRLPEKQTRKKRSWVLGYKALAVLAGLWLFWAVDSGVLEVISRDFGPKLNAEAVKLFAEESLSVSGDLKARLRFLQQLIERAGLVVSDCNSMDFNWELVQDAHIFFHWRCVMYQSLSEEVSIWGSPLRTSGLLPTGCSSRSLTLLSGRITEWSEGRPASISRTSNGSSWTTQAWNLAAVHLEEGTWVVEYQRSILFQGLDLIPAALKVLKVRALKVGKALKQDLWRLLLVPALPDLDYHRLEDTIMHPT